jgi:hypothetical protein
MTRPAARLADHVGTRGRATTRACEHAHAVLVADCQGLGKGLGGKFVRFQCNVLYGGSNGSYQVKLRLRVQQIGSGKLCVSALQLVPRWALPPWRVPPDEIITRLIRPEKTCTA